MDDHHENSHKHLYTYLLHLHGPQDRSRAERESGLGSSGLPYIVAPSAEFSALSVAAVGVVAAGGRDVVGILTEGDGMLSSAHARGNVAVVDRHISIPFRGAVGQHSHLNGIFELCLQMGFFFGDLLVNEKLRLLLVNLLELGPHLLHRHLLVGRALFLLLLPV